MPYIPTGTFSTPHKMRLLLADCPTVRDVLLADDVTAALAKIYTYGAEADANGTPRLSYPRILIRDSEVHLATDEGGGLLDVNMRTLEVWIAFYIPDDNPNIVDVNDEHAWVLDQFSAINDECLARAGQGESIPGHTHLCVANPIFEGAEREPHDERGDEATDPYPEQARWFGLLMYEVK